MINYAPLIIGIDGLNLSADEAKIIARESVGGVILFQRNYKNKKQLKALISAIRKVKKNLIITVDHEGGRVQRFKDEFTPLPAMQKLGTHYDKNQTEALTFAYALGYVLATELIEVGVDMSFTPVLDLNYARSEVIGDRAFHKKPEAVIKLANALISAMKEAGMACVGKHFPGHGFVQSDSHAHLPIDTRSFRELKDDINVFRALTQELDAIMPAHIIYKEIDTRPASFSEVWLKKILIEGFGYRGIIISDDLYMKGAALYIANLFKRVERALLAGCDMVLLCESLQSLKNYENDLDLVTGKTYKTERTPPFKNLYAKRKINKTLYNHYKEHLENLI